MATVATALMTAEEFGELPSNGLLEELIRGVPVAMNMPYPRHGELCFRVGYLLQRFLDDHRIGRVITNDSGVITERDPDTVRGPDVAFYSFDRVPRGPLPRRGYLSVVPEVVFEVRSPTDRWPDILVKIGEYLQAGVTAVVVLDSQTEELHAYFTGEEAPQILRGDQALQLPPPLNGWRVVVRQFFE
ncbi:Uma2 family endonuclease [Limnoglobus roseus]|uniref:Uma2 family endonuclease n=1 Tax=Limnoglobus roseus TaxID=2598579 RepID=A0A5C1AM34_9BACT|nr:Uma2 family endonuclease [Limnoglobus roseus]QEL20281.1 Uma2 family endonuclease [Limnoglobus roseus]